MFNKKQNKKIKIKIKKLMHPKTLIDETITNAFVFKNKAIA